MRVRHINWKNSYNFETYTGATKNTFKERYYGHAQSFRLKEKEHATTLSSYIWKLKEKGVEYNTKWSIIEKGKAFNLITQKCGLCLKEKYNIIFQPEGETLNSRSELFSTCNLHVQTFSVIKEHLDFHFGT